MNSLSNGLQQRITTEVKVKDIRRRYRWDINSMRVWIIMVMAEYSYPKSSKFIFYWRRDYLIVIFRHSLLYLHFNKFFLKRVKKSTEFNYMKQIRVKSFNTDTHVNVAKFEERKLKIHKVKSNNFPFNGKWIYWRWKTNIQRWS